MTNNDNITHAGVVTKCSNSRALIRLAVKSECHSCTIKNICGIDQSDKSLIEVPAGNLHIGDAVQLTVTTSFGFTALMWAYMIPFLLVVMALFASYYLGLSEALSGLFSLAILVPYFLALYFLKERIKNQLQYQVHKK
jgi:sigma-E factor negative regulatory protein RseC